MNIDKLTIIILATILISIALFLTINQSALVYAIKMLSLYIGQMLMFLFITGISIVTLNFRENKHSNIVGTFLPIIFLLFVVMYNLLLTRSISNISLSSPERIPIDWGLMGFAFILINGSLLSHTLIVKNIDKTERLLLSLGLGFGTTSLMMILLAIIWEISIFTVILTQSIILIVLLIIALLRKFKPNLKEKQNFLKEKRHYIVKTNLVDALILTVILVHTIMGIYQTIAYPAVEWDSLAYGFNYAKIIYESKGVPLIAGPSIGLEMSANYPPGVQLLAAYLYLFAGTPNDFYYRILQPIFGIAVMIVTYKLAALITKNKTLSLFAVLILCIIPTFWDNFVLETYLMNLTLMLTLSAYFFLKAYNTSDHNKEKYEIIGTLLCGFSALTSYIGLFSLGILMLYAIHKKLRLKRLISLTILASLIILPWYLRNLLLLGNPVYPLFGIGARLDPLLESSTVQHFQNWLKGSLFGMISILCKFGACFLSSVIVYLTFIKRNNFTITLTLYLLLISTLTMALHIPFTRYLLIALPTFAVALSATIKSSIAKQDLLEKSMAVALTMLILISNINVIPYLNLAKPMYSANNKWDYLTQLYEDADAWKWISENTPQNATIATYDIREYYLGHKVMLLDGYNAAPIYKMSTIEEAINYLKQQNVTHILSVTWASPTDARMPPAYKWCILTRYFGDPRYLPAVFVGQKGATVYHVGPLEEKSLYEIFSQENFVPPLKHLEINLTITNQTNPPSGRFYIPIPIDYREGLMVTSTNTYGHPVNIELRSGIIPENTTNWQESFTLVKSWPPQSINTSVENPSFVWEVDTAGYLTFLALAENQQYEESFNITVNIDFYNYWDKNTLFIKEGLETYNITIANDIFPLIKVLYIQINEPSVLSINCTTYGKKISIQICRDFIPNTAAMNWSKQYEIIRQQPDLNETTGEINPSIQNMFLSYGKYTILIVYRDSYIEQDYILSNITLTSLK